MIMTREEEITKASHLYATYQQKPFVDGAKWADKTMIDKACEWLDKNFNMPNDFQKHFRKAMEE